MSFASKQCYSLGEGKQASQTKLFRTKQTMLLFNRPASKFEIEVPAANVIEEIQCRIDMKDALWKKDTIKLIDKETNNGILIELFPVATSLWFGNIGQSLNYDWLKLLFIPMTEHDALPTNKKVCSVYLKIESMKNLLNLIQLASTKGINLPDAIVKTKFERIEKSYTDKETGEAKKTDSRPLQFIPIKANPEQAKLIAKFKSALAEQIPEIEALQNFNSGHDIIPMTGTAEDKRKQDAFKALRANGNQFLLPESQSMSAELVINDETKAKVAALAEDF